MIAWRSTSAGVLVPMQYRPSSHKPAAPCPPAIREKMAELRAEFAQRAGRK